MSDTIPSAVMKRSGPQSLEELRRKGPATREEIDALAEKYGMGVGLTNAENDRVAEYFKTRRNAGDLATLLGVLYPNCEWTMRGTKKDNQAKTFDDRNPNTWDAALYEQLEWDDDNPLPKPTKAELQKMIPFVQDILDQEAYIKMRRQFYPTEPQMVRAMWEYIVEGNKEGIDALQARRLAVKKRFPKPENKHWMVQSEDYLRVYPNSPADILRDIDEEELRKLAFSPGVQSEDAEPLATSLSLSEQAEKILAKRAKSKVGQQLGGDNHVFITPTLEDVDELKEKLSKSNAEDE